MTICLIFWTILVVSCGDTLVVANASNNYVPGVYGDVSQFSCHHGNWFEDGVYELETTCTLTGEWQPVLPSACKSMCNVCLLLFDTFSFSMTSLSTPD